MALGHNADIIPRVSIRLYGIDRNRVGGPVAYDRAFNIGDTATYDSYNLIYLGKIVAIGAKSVTIDDDGKLTRLNIYDFSARNRCFDLAKIEAHNRDTMNHI